MQKIKRLINSLEAREIALPSKFVAALVLNNLNKEFDYLVTIITQDLRSNKEIDLDQIFGQILDESRRLKGIKSPFPLNREENNTSKDLEMSLNTSNKKSTKSYNNNLSSDSESSNKCLHCHKTGHNIDKCWVKNPHLRPKSKKHYKASNATSTLEEEALNTKTVIKVDSNINNINYCSSSKEIIK